jgi:hypothetical protein
MTTNEDLSLFCTFPIDDQVALLMNPTGRLSPRLVQRLSHPAGGVRSDAMFTSNPASGDVGFVLSDHFIKRLNDIRRHLDNW